ncbi:MAG: cyclomaltodextrinase N-terminal domain-containing protein [Acidobacteria bacterium]|nr:cyclomaltodextrinase N-terminal domain-containing protein [Acidobacteriota bacterium]
MSHTGHTKRAARLGAALLFACCLAFASADAQHAAPTILKVEPPNWWADHSINPVRVLIRGRNLSGARVEVRGAGLRASRVSTNAAGTYLFADVTVAPHAAPGVRTLRLSTPGGVSEAPFEISAPLARAGRFQGFTTDDVIYLIMTDRFSDGDSSNDDPDVSRGLYDRTKTRYYHGGDFQGVINHLSYLRDLGVTAIWLTPWYDNVNHLNEREQYPDKPGGAREPITDYHGYGAVDYYGVEEHFGSMNDLRRLVDEAHRNGIKVIQDEVANHTGPYHPWNVEGAPTATWYNGTQARHLANNFQTWVLHDPHALPQLKRTVLEGWFVDILPDMNQHDPEAARYEIQNTLWWIGMTGVDAIRQDTWQYVPDSFWRDWTAAVKREYPHVNVVGEVLDGDVAHTSFYQGGRARFDRIDTGLDTLFDFPLLYPVRRAFAEGKPLREAVQIVSYDHLYPNPSVLLPLIGNHDMPRFMSEPGADVAGLKLAETLVMTMRGTPQLYYGDEIAMRGAGDPDNRRDFPGGWAGDAHNAFDTGARTPEERDAFDRLRLLGRLRRELEPLRRGALVNLYVAEQQWAYARKTERDAVVVAFNNDAKPATFVCDARPTGLAEGTRLSDRLSASQSVSVADGKLAITLPARSAAIFAASGR